MIERVITFGRRSDQVGILCQPGPQQAAGERPAFVMWNVGLNHRVAPFRSYVDLCRMLAAQGFTAFRFDTGGLGDSEVRRDAVSDTERENMDVSEAMDVVTKRTGIRSFILVGFCSSVDAAYRVAVKDPRVVGSVHLEGYAYQSPGYRKRLPLRLLSKERWRRFFKAQEVKLRARLSQSAPAGPAPEPVFQRDKPRWSEFRQQLQALTERGVSMLFVYAGGDTLVNHREQFWEMFATPKLDRSRIEVEYYPDTDHTFFGLEGRTAVLQNVVRWGCARFGSAQAPKEALSVSG